MLPVELGVHLIGGVLHVESGVGSVGGLGDLLALRQDLVLGVQAGGDDVAKGAHLLLLAGQPGDALAHVVAVGLVELVVVDEANMTMVSAGIHEPIEPADQTEILLTPLQQLLMTLGHSPSIGANVLDDSFGSLARHG